MLPDFNRLKVFYHIFNEQSSTGASKVLHISQSGVSQHLKKLEEELQLSLFTRVNRSLVPTAAGHKLYLIVQHFMTQLEEGVQQLSASTEKPSGLLRLGAPSEFGSTHLPTIFASFNRKYRDVSFHLELGDPSTLFTMISAGKLDFAYIDILPFFIDTPGGPTAYSIEPIVKEEFVLACSKEYFEEQVGGAGYDDLIRLKYIGYKRDIALFHSWFELHFGTAPSSLNLVLVADDAGVIISSLEEGMGLGIIVSHLISQQVNQGLLIPLRPTTNELHNTIACVRFKERRETITERIFQEHLRTELHTISEVKVIRS